MTNQYILARITGRDPNLRASDADPSGWPTASARATPRAGST